MTARLASVHTLHPDYSNDAPLAFEQFLFEHLRTKTAQLLRLPETWAEALGNLTEKECAEITAAYVTADICQVGRIVTRAAYGEAEDQARALLEDEFDSIKKDDR